MRNYHSTHTGCAEEIMRRVRRNLTHFTRCETPQSASGWQQVVIEPGPASDQAAVCLLVNHANDRAQSA